LLERGANSPAAGRNLSHRKASLGGWLQNSNGTSIQTEAAQQAPPTMQAAESAPLVG
jgi:hypothetical protein